MSRAVAAFCFILFSVLIGPKAEALRDRSLYVGTGLLSQNLTKTSQSPSGSAGFLGTGYYPLFLQYYFRIGDDWHLGPSLGYTLLPRYSADKGSRSTYLILALPFTRILTGNDDHGLNWNLGPALIMYTIQGDGGLLEMPNGTTTATFAAPSGLSRTQTVALSAGMGYAWDEWHFKLDFLTEGFLTIRRSYTMLLTVNYAPWGRK
jgi:hypothetical protein